MEKKAKLTNQEKEVLNKQKAIASFIKEIDEEEIKETCITEYFSFTVKEILNWKQFGTLEQTKKQRGSAWTEATKNQLIKDSLKKGLKLPAIELYIMVPENMPIITFNEYLNDIDEYKKNGYKLVILDGSQRIRNLYGFYTNQTIIKKGKSTFTFKDLPVEKKLIFERNELRVLVYSGYVAEFTELFIKRNTSAKPLNDMEILNCIYAETDVMSELLKLTKNEDIQEIFGVDASKVSFDMTCEEEELKPSDRGAFLREILKLLVHFVSFNGLLTSGKVNEAISSYLEHSLKMDNATLSMKHKQFLDCIKVFRLLSKNGYVLENKTSKNRIRSMFAAMIVFLRNDEENFLNNIDRINEYLETFDIKVSGDASGQKSRVNLEISSFYTLYSYAIYDEFVALGNDLAGEIKEDKYVAMQIQNVVKISA